MAVRAAFVSARRIALRITLRLAGNPVAFLRPAAEVRQPASLGAKRAESVGPRKVNLTLAHRTAHHGDPFVLFRCRSTAFANVCRPTPCDCSKIAASRRCTRQPHSPSRPPARPNHRPGAKRFCRLAACSSSGPPSMRNLADRAACFNDTYFTASSPRRAAQR